MTVLAWVATILGGFGAGVLWVQYLTVHPLQMGGYLAGAVTVSLATLLMAVAMSSGAWVVVALTVVMAALIAGYWLMTRQVLAREDDRLLPILRRDLVHDAGLGHTAVIYFTHGEPETYDPIGWLNQFREFDEQGIAFVPLLVRPLFIYQLRRKYLQVGRSDHRRVHQRMLSSLERAYRQQGDATTRFYLSFLDDDPRPDAALVTALNDGASQIIVAEVFLTISNHTAEGKHLIAKRLDGQNIDGLPIHYTGPLWDSATLQQMFVQRANTYLDGIAKEDTAILLVGHGQPDAWDQEWPTETAQEIAFRQAILELLVEEGYQRENLAVAWMEFRRPRPAQAVERFVAQGVRQVLYYSAAISADSIHSQFDVPELVEEAHVPEGMILRNLGAWNDDPLVIQAIKERIDVSLRELDRAQPTISPE